MTRKAPLAMEPRSYTAEYEKRRDAITLYTSSNIPGIVRDAISESLGLPGHRLRVVAPDVGGSFGSKGSLYPEELLICIAARKLGRSLKWTADRLEDVSSSSQAFAEIVDAEMGFDANGVATVAAGRRHRRRRRLFDLSLDLRPGAGPGREFPSGPLQDRIVSRCRARRRHLQAADRSLSRRRPADLDFRHRTLDGYGRQGARPRSPRDQAPQSRSVRRNFRTGSRPASSGTRRASSNAWRPPPRPPATSSFASEQADARKQGRLFGIGIASYAELTGIGSRIAVAPGMPINTGSETAKITIDSTGAITAAFGVASHGQGLETTLAQIVADDLGAKLRGYPRRPGRQRRGADVDRHLCEPQRGARRRRGQACVISAAGQDQTRRLASPGSQPGRYRCLRRQRRRHRYRPRGDVQADRESGLFRHEDACRSRRARN